MNSGGSPAKGGDQGGTGKPANTVNERTYQEVEYLKKNLGPILVAALAEICIRRPADPIEYLGHWLLRWRYNEELKRRDVQNALDVVRQRQWAQVQDETAAIKQEKYAAGFVPDQPHGPPGYGGPLSGEELGETQKEVEETEFHPEEVAGEGGEEIVGEGGPIRPDVAMEERKRSLAHSQAHSLGKLEEEQAGDIQAPVDQVGNLENVDSKGGPGLEKAGSKRASLEAGRGRAGSMGQSLADSVAQPEPQPPAQIEHRKSLEPAQPRRNSKENAPPPPPDSVGSAPPVAEGGEPPAPPAPPTDQHRKSDASSHPPADAALPPEQ